MYTASLDSPRMISDSLKGSKLKQGKKKRKKDLKFPPEPQPEFRKRTRKGCVWGADGRRTTLYK